MTRVRDPAKMSTPAIVGEMLKLNVRKKKLQLKLKWKTWREKA